MLPRIPTPFALLILFLLSCASHSLSAVVNHRLPDDNLGGDLITNDTNGGLDLSMSAEDVKALGLHSKQDNQSDSLAESLKNLGLTEKELTELRKTEDDTNPNLDSVFHGKQDRRAVDAPPPPAMAAPASSPSRKSANDAADAADLALAPNELDLSDVRRDELKVRGGGESEGMKGGENEKGVAGDNEDERKREEERRKKTKMETATLRARVAELEKVLEDAREEAEKGRVELQRSKDMFQKTLRSEKEERRNEKEELTSTIEERKRAFDELFEEKQVLGQILNEEQKTLHELQEKIQHPDLGLWIKQRAERAAILLETPETDAIKFYARKYMAPEVSKIRHRLESLESRVKKGVDHLLPAKYGSVVALLLTIGLIGFPVVVTMSTVVSVTKSVSLRQYVLLGNVFLTAFSGGLCIAGVILQQDPLQTLYEASESLFVILQIAAAIAFPVFVVVIACAVWKARDREDLFVFGCQFVFYVLVGWNYRTRVWRPAMLGENIETSRMMYVVYVIDFLSMTALTISSAKLNQSRMGGFGGDRFTMSQKEAIPSGHKVTGVTANTSAASTRSGLGAIGSSLVEAAIKSNNRMSKEE